MASQDSMFDPPRAPSCTTQLKTCRCRNGTIILRLEASSGVPAIWSSRFCLILCCNLNQMRCHLAHLDHVLTSKADDGDAHRSEHRHYVFREEKTDGSKVVATSTRIIAAANVDSGEEGNNDVNDPYNIEGRRKYGKKRQDVGRNLPSSAKHASGWHIALFWVHKTEATEFTRIYRLGHCEMPQCLPLATQ